MVSAVPHHEAAADGPVVPSGLDHIVIHVRDFEESHRFWTGILGLRQVGEFKPSSPGVPARGTMRFYSGDRGGPIHHHDVALIEDPPSRPDLRTLRPAPSCISLLRCPIATPGSASLRSCSATVFRSSAAWSMA